MSFSKILAEFFFFWNFARPANINKCFTNTLTIAGSMFREVDMTILTVHAYVVLKDGFCVLRMFPY